MNPKRIVITGGPGTGKTSVIKALETMGFYSFHEIIRSMTLAAKKQGNEEDFTTNPLAFVSDPYLFNQKLLQGRVAQFQSASSLKDPVVFYDRGIPDVLAYMNYFKQEFDKEFVLACTKNQYDQVLLLPPWQAIYKADNERLESFEQAIEIHGHLDATYKSFGYRPKIVPEGTIEQRAAFVLSSLNRDND